MSGIAGSVRLDGAPACPRTLTRMAEAMAFRGPDGNGSRAAGPAGLAHALLRATDDAETRPGPLSLDGETWITADARLDGRAGLARALRDAGRRVAPSASDAELVLHAYLAWGEECVDRLDGDFAFAVWDGPRRRLFLARDRFGVKPLFYAEAGGELVFSNTPDALRAHPAVSAEPCELALGEFLVFGYLHDLGLGFHRGTRTLPPAHALTVEDGTVRLRRWWTLPAEAGPGPRGMRECVEVFREVFGEAVADRLRGPAAAVQMSGGRDSTAVAATARRVAPGLALKAFTTFFGRLIPDEEQRYAEIAAGALGVPLDLLPMDGYRPFERWDTAALRRPWPVDDPLLAVDADQLARMAAHARAGLTGHGGDATLRESRSRLVRLAAAGKPLRALREAAGYARLHRRLPRPGVRSWLRDRAGERPWRPPFPAWLRPEAAERLGLRERWEAAFALRPPGHPLRPEAYDHLTGPLLPRYLERVDPGATGLALELRHPFLDLRMVSLALSVPPAQWYNDKGLLVAAMRSHLPAAVLRRPKTPLPGDPVAATLREAGGVADGLALAPAAEALVDRRALPRYAGGDADGGPDEAWLHLRPLALSLWLRSGANR